MSYLAKFFDMNTLYVIMLATVEIFSDFSLERYANFGGLKYLGIGAAGYAGVVFLLIKALRGYTILYINNVWDGISSLIESIAAFVILGERFTHPRQYFAVLLIVAGLVLIRV